MSDARPRIVVVTRHWGDDDDASGITRLIAGGLAIHGDVDVVHLAHSPFERHSAESVFSVHTLPLLGASPVASAVAASALRAAHGGEPSGHLLDVLDSWEGTAPTAAPLIASLHPDVVVLAGHSQPFDLSGLDALVAAQATRVIVVPLLHGAPALGSPRLEAVLGRADVIATAHPGETRTLLERFPHLGPSVALDVALPINRSATSQGLFGVGWYGEYVVAIRRFPADGGRYAHSVSRDVLVGALGGIAVAEVDGSRWRISNATDTSELPVNPTRVNLWRLMANGLMTIDLRPPDVVGREALESMLLGVPPVVPDGSAAMAHVEAADGGLWYRNLGEIVDSARALMDDPLRKQLGLQARSYAELHHQDMDGFVRRLGTLIAPEGSAVSAER